MQSFLSWSSSVIQNILMPYHHAVSWSNRSSPLQMLAALYRKSTALYCSMSIEPNASQREKSSCSGKQFVLWFLLTYGCPASYRYLLFFLLLLLLLDLTFSLWRTRTGGDGCLPGWQRGWVLCFARWRENFTDCGRGFRRFEVPPERLRRTFCFLWQMWVGTQCVFFCSPARFCRVKFIP